MIGRKIELIAEDSVNPQTAVDQGAALIERDKVVAIIGEISSASGLAIAAGRAAQPDHLLQHRLQLRRACAASPATASCSTPKAANSMYVNTAGTRAPARRHGQGQEVVQPDRGLRFRPRSLRVAKRFMQANGGEFAADDLVPTDATDFSAYLLKIRNAKPDLVISNLAGAQITNFMKQYVEYGLPFPVGGFRLRHRGGVGRGQGQRARHLAAGVGFTGQHAGLAQTFTERVQRRRTASRRRTRPGATTCRPSISRRR